MKLSRIAVLFASAVAVLAPAAPAVAASDHAVPGDAATATPAIFEDPFGFVAPVADSSRDVTLAYIDNPRSVLSIFENPFD